MIVSYRDRKTQRFADGNQVKEFSSFARQAESRLDLTLPGMAVDGQPEPQAAAAAAARSTRAAPTRRR